MSAEEEVRESSARFYAALSRMAQGVVGAMDDVWSHDAGSTAMHPIAGREVGWDNVKSSFDQFAQIAKGGHVALKDQWIHVLGDVAYELGIEYGGGTLGGIPATWEHRVTNIYRREGGAWKMVHHHSDPSSTILDVLRQLQGKATIQAGG
jgi:ketosteroid isomerase-like protein